jgi:large subunit ribosomal protein L10
MNRQEKEQEVVNISERFKKSKAMIFAGYRGLKVAEITELRSKLRKTSSSMKVVKNRLVKRVLEKEGLKDLEQYFHEPTAIATSESDPASVAKVLVEFAKDHGMLKLKGGYLEGKFLDLKSIDALAKLPSREVLLSRAMASMLAPATNLACVLNALPQKLVRAINAIKEKKTQ